MDVALLYLFNTILLPLTITLFAFGGLTRLRVSWASMGALALGFIVAYAAIFALNGLWGTDATRWVIWGTLTMGLALELSPRFLVKISPLLVITLGLYLCLSPLAGMWREGLVKPLLNEWVLGAWLIGGFACLVLITQLHLEHKDVEDSAENVSPAYFASLALSYAIAAPCIGLSGSASIAQLLGALGVVTASLGIISLWKSLPLSISAYLSAYMALFLTVVYAHFYLTPSFSHAVASLLTMSPLAATLTYRWHATPMKRVIMSVLITAPLLLLGLGLIAAHELDKAEAETDEFGVSY